jgi:signal transduction histidine kinase
MPTQDTPRSEQLAALLAHEVKNPVALIKANIDYIQPQCPQSCCKSFRIINRELRRLSSIISNYSILSRQRDDSRDELVFIEDLLTDITEEYSLTPLGKGIKFKLSSCDNLKVKGDYNKLYILFFNVIKNAVEAVSENGIISCSLSLTDDYVKIDIYNSGDNIPDNILSALGQPYVTTKPSGNGLGILICKSIVKEHNGSMYIKNVEGGCVVSVNLPAVK